MLTESLDQLADSGYTLLESVFAPQATATLADRLAAALARRDDASVLRSRGRVYGSRNLIETFPEVNEIPRQAVLAEFITSVLGPDAGLVRGLFFDKPPDRSWSLPWHRDLTIAVKSNELPSSKFRKPTFKAGIPHVEAPESLLAGMLTLRVHLDAMTAENGPLSVIPGSHVPDQDANGDPVELQAAAGDVLAMRPLLLHSSVNSQPQTSMHRRVIHLELAPCRDLPDGYEWHCYCPVAR